jgi:ligand-binding SRPBCC domain-containing protein
VSEFRYIGSNDTFHTPTNGWAGEHGARRFESARSEIIPTFSKTTEIEATASRVFAWHQSPDALKTLIPPWERVSIAQAPQSLRDGNTAILVLRIGPLRLKWVARHRDFIDLGESGGEFTDEQVSGPFASWVHRHIVRSAGPDRCVLEDRVEYTLPLGVLGELVGGGHVRRKLVRMFDYRHQATREAVEKRA